MQLETDFSTTPDQVPQVDAGVYGVSIDKVEFKDAEANRKARHAFEMSITNEGPMKGRKIYTDFAVEHLANPQSPASVEFKKLLVACGYPLGRVDTDQLVGRQMLVKVGKRAYKDKNTGQQKTATQIEEYIPPTAASTTAPSA